MKMLLSCAAACLVPAAGVAADRQVIAPGPTALELAALLPAMGPAGGEAADGQKEDAIARQFLSTQAPRGRACDPGHAECRRIATQMAAEIAPKLAEWSRRRGELFAAYFLQATMSEPEMRQAIAFLKTPSGANLAAALGRIARPRIDSDRDLAVYAEVVKAAPQPPSLDFDAFYERTSHLPRRPLPLIPPPPRPPEPPRSD